MIATPFQETLARLRAQTPLTQKQLAHRSGTSTSSVNRWEMGNGTPKRDNVEQVGSALERAGVPRARSLLLAALRRTTDGSALPEWAQDLDSIEQVAQHVTVVTPAMVPGYLQSPELAGAIFRAGMPGATPDTVDRLVAVRTKQLGELSDLAVTAVFPAAALTCLPEDIRRAQAQYLIEWVETGRVALHLVPDGMALLVPAAPVMVFRLRTGDTAITSDHADGNFVYDDSRHARVSGEVTAALAASLPHPLSLDILRKWTA